jgi:hypothetical protein
MSNDDVKRETEAVADLPGTKTAGDTTIVLEVAAAYNRGGLTMPRPNGPNGRRVLNLEMLMNHPFYWEWLNERETEEVLMEIYIARTRRAQ